MAELINRVKIRTEVDKLHKERYINERTMAIMKGLIDGQPTVTEADIRAKAIDEFAEKLKQKSVWTVNGWCVPNVVIAEIAEQLKGE